MSSIFVIMYQYEEDDYYYRTIEALEDEFGFFTDRAAAQKAVDNLNVEEFNNVVSARTKEWDKEYEKAMATYNQAIREFEILWDAGIEKEEPVRPQRKVWTQTFEAYVAAQSDKYIVKELTRNGS